MNAPSTNDRRTAASVIAMGLLLAAAGPVLAAEPPPEAVEGEKARQYAADGALHYRLGRFQEALESYTKAFEVAQLPALLFNIGQCHKMLKNHERAIFFFEGFLRAKPEAKSRPMVEALIDESKKELAAAAQGAEAARAAEAERARAEAVERERLAAQKAHEPRTGEVATVATPNPEVARARARAGARTKLVVGAALIAVGVAGLGSAVGLGLASRSATSELERARSQGAAWDNHAQSTYDGGVRFASSATALFVVGGVLVGAGTLLAILGARQRMKARALASTPAPLSLAFGRP